MLRFVLVSDILLAYITYDILISTTTFDHLVPVL